jgi:ribosomal protein L21E
MKNIKLLDVVALTEDMPEHKLHRGQVGTVVEVFNDGEAYEVEFADLEGHTYEMLAVEPSKLMVLQYEPEAVAA